ncbi:MAG TPA: CDF family Co(II)/Ni(II) efflux transporter DmeF [Candidatus Omnitrophota bacterium]|nr:CDF family Co(II)/Ni(II) efflux transporter DmeF [Candidatus Omnitrophota bacterium]
MHAHDLDRLQHGHEYEAADQGDVRRVKWVTWLTIVTMVVEIAAGMAFGSMALTADGWHMATHAGALGIALLAYWVARRGAGDRSYTFGTGKVTALGGFTNAIALALVGLALAWESVQRLFVARTIAYDEALAVAVLGLAVNLASAWLLGGGHHHHDHGHDDDHHHHDHNLRGAYMHVLADAATSVLAIVALAVGKVAGWVWLDPAMGIVGGIVIGRWAWGLARETAGVLLDRDSHDDLNHAIRTRLEAIADVRLTDLHVWWLAPGRHGAIVSLVTAQPQSPDFYKQHLAELGLAHVTVEVNPCGCPE